MVGGWRTVPPAAWLRVAPSAEVGELEWMVQVGPAGGTDGAQLLCERPFCTGCACRAQNTESCAAEWARSVFVEVDITIRFVATTPCRPPPGE